MRRSHLLTVFCLSLLWIESGCTKLPNYWDEAKPGQKRILVSFPPLYAITHAVAGDDAYVLSMLSVNGPHGYDFNTTDLSKVNKARYQRKIRERTRQRNTGGMLRNRGINTTIIGTKTTTMRLVKLASQNGR